MIKNDEFRKSYSSIFNINSFHLYLKNLFNKDRCSTAVRPATFHEMIYYVVVSISTVGI